MKQILLTAFVITMLVSCGNNGDQKSGTNSAAKTAPKTSVAPDFSALDIYGKQTVTLSAYRGKVVLINFWATWCPPCRQEIPDLVALQKENADKLVIIGISLDQEGPQVVQDFAQKNGITYPMIMATEKVVGDYGGISAIPTSFVLDKSGNVVGGMIVGGRSKAQFAELIKSSLN